MKEHKQDKIIYYQQTTKHGEINQHSDRENVGIQKAYSSIPRESYDQKLQHEQIQVKLKLQTQRKQLRITKWGRRCAS